MIVRLPIDTYGESVTPVLSHALLISASSTLLTCTSIYSNHCRELGPPFFPIPASLSTPTYIMPPHGRRRLTSLTLLLSFLFLFAGTASAASAVLGIDLGTEYIKAALVKPGIPLDIVLTKDSKRKETAAVAFKGTRTKVNTATNENFPERIYGGDAVALSARFPGDVYPNLKSLLGLSYKDDMVANYQRWRPELRLVELEGTGSVGFKSNSFVKEEESFMVEELLAMELKNVKANAETMAGKGHSVQDVVITVPSYYTVEERKAVTLAADLAGLRVSSLISDGLAVGLNYATSRTFPTVNNGGKPEVHLIFDMGAGSTTATVLKFQGRTVKDVGRFNKTIQEVQVLGTSWDKSLGGDALNGVIVDDMIAKMLDTTHMKNLELTAEDVKAHGRTMAKLWKEAERIRQVLSANTETQTSMESLYYEDFNFKYKFKRSDFERLTADFAARVQNPLTEALESAKLSLPEIDSVILHGGAVRTPFVQKQLEGLIKDSDRIRTNVNSDEAAVFGAAFKAAGISPSFRVKEIRAADTAVYPVFVSYLVEGKDKQQKIFVPTSLVGSTEKQVTFKTTEDFSFDLFQQVSLPLKDHRITTVQSQNLTESVKTLLNKGCEAADISTKFAIRLSPSDSLPEVLGATVSCDVVNTKKAGSVVDGMKDFLGFGSKKDEQKPLNHELDLENSSSSTADASTSETSITSTTTSSKASTTSTSEDIKATDKASKRKTEIVNVNFTSTQASSQALTPESLTRIKSRLVAFDASDESRVLREEALNMLEGYTYKIRDILEDEAVMDVSTPAQRDEIEQKSNDASMWLYGDGAEASRDVLKGRLDELRGLVNPIQKRKEEAVNRPVEIERLKDTLSQAKTMVEMVKQQQDAQSMSESELAASISSSSNSDASASSSTTTAESSSTADPLDELDNDPVTSSESVKSSNTAAPSAEPIMPMYTMEDLEAVTTKEATIKLWLEEKLAEQEELSPTDDPAVLSSDLAAKSKELNEAVMDMLTKQMKNIPKPGGEKKAKASSSGSKSKKPKATSSSTVTIDTASLETDVETETPAAANGGAWNAAPTDVKTPEEELEGMEGIHKMSREELEQAMKDGEIKFGDEGGKDSKASKKGERTKTPKPKSTKKAKTKNGKSKSKSGKAKDKKSKGKERNVEEREL